MTIRPLTPIPSRVSHDAGCSPPASLCTVHFGGQSPSPPAAATPEKKTAWADRLFFDPLAEGFGYVAFHPRIFRRVLALMTLGKPQVAGEEATIRRCGPVSPPIPFASLDPGVTLSGRWLPSTTPSSRTIVMGHGYASRWTSMAPLAQALRQSGYHVFLFDFRAHGRSTGSETTFGLEEGRDIAAAVQYVKTHYPQQSQRLFYYGHSMGAAALMAAPWALGKGKPGGPKAMARLNAQLDGVILDSPYASLADFLTNHLRTLISTRPLSRLLQSLWPQAPLHHFAERFRHSLKRSDGPWHRRLPLPVSQIRPASLMCDTPGLITKPLLLIHGSSDRVTDFHQGLRNYEQIRHHNPAAQLLVLEGEDHSAAGFTPDKHEKKRYDGVLRGGDRALNAIRAFLEAPDAPAPNIGHDGPRRPGS